MTTSQKRIIVIATELLPYTDITLEYWYLFTQIKEKEQIPLFVKHV